MKNRFFFAAILDSDPDSTS